MPADDQLSFSGPYTVTETTCTDHATLEPYFPWYDKSTGEAVVSWVWTDAETLDAWFADESETDFGVRAAWYMYDMSAVYYPDALYASYSESYTDSGGAFAIVYEVEVSFSE